MKPVIKKQHIYSILLMRDDSAVRRFRMRSLWLKFLLLFFVFLCLGTAAGAYGSYYYWKRFSVAQSELKDVELKLRAARPDLERLANIDAMASRNITSVNSVGTANATKGPSEVSPAKPATSESAGVSTALAATLPGTTVSASITTRNATAATSALGAESPAAGTPTDVQPGAQEAHAAKIANMSLRASGTTRIRIAFDLTNQNQPQPLNGRVSLALIGKDGTITPVTPVAGVERDDSRFYINRYKRINTSVALPQDLQTAQVYGVRVTIEAEGQPPLVEEFPLP